MDFFKKKTYAAWAPSILIWMLLLAIGPRSTNAQAASSIHGTVVDVKGTAIANAIVKFTRTGSEKPIQMSADNEGKFSAGLADGTYSVDASAPGFALTTQKDVQVNGGQSNPLTLALKVGGITDQITVEASTSSSIAAQYAPLDGLLEARSARTVVSLPFIQNFTSPLADYSEVIQQVPGTFSVGSNGVGLGDTKNYFRGFADGQYNIAFDGIPWNDTNSPTHHSWAFFPSQWLGGVDFDRSPGSASTIGPTPFGGTINLLSREMSPQRSVRGSVAYGSFNTVLYDGIFETGRFGGVGKRSNAVIDVHRMTSDGYQTFNNQSRTAGSLKYQFKVSENTTLTGFSGVIRLNANTPNQKGATRAQIAQFGDNFLLTNDPSSPLYYKFNTYYVPTDFEYVGVKSQLKHGWAIDVKPYTYSYYNQQFYNGVTSITSTSATDKLNSYRKYGETSTVSQVSRFGTFRTGFWYEWATTNRYQIPSDPRTRVDQVLPSFHERFWTNTYQPFAEYEYHATRKLTLTGGLKFARFTQDLKQYADNGGAVGSVDANGKPFEYIRNYGAYNAYLPAFDANYRLKTNWSAYGQFATGAVIPPSSVFDVSAKRQLTTTPKPSSARSFQTGSVLKLKRVTLNGDFYYIRFGNTYTAPADPNFVNYTSTGDSISKGFEGDTNIYFGHGLSIYANGTAGSARYVSSTVGDQPNPNNGKWVAFASANTESIGLTYQQRYLDLGIFNKRVGPMWNDGTAPGTATNSVIGATANQVVPIDPFNVTNVFFNYTVRAGSLFDQTKIKLSFNNLFDQHNIIGVTQSNKSFSYSPSGADVVQLLPGRSVMLSVTIGLTAKR
ncbi:MAG TPA: TonB-dependent receptor [Edaphobacter sp.]|nr:TonB-dependent receptor [Edaphobacter sp.]